MFETVRACLALRPRQTWLVQSLLLARGVKNNVARYPYKNLPKSVWLKPIITPTMDFSTTAERSAAHHDIHARPPMFMQIRDRELRNMKRADLENDVSIVDFSNPNGLSEEHKRAWKMVEPIPACRIEEAMKKSYDAALDNDSATQSFQAPVKDGMVYESQEFPGLRVISGLLPPKTQIDIVTQLMHRDLANPGHKHNLQSDYNIQYPPETAKKIRSFFLRPRADPSHTLIPQKETQKPLSTEQFLYSKLRWLTLGDQYDWPTRTYSKHVTPFPTDLSTLVNGLFPHIQPQSGVVLIYSPKDFMPVHRDVSEQCERALASISLGCDGIFVMGKGEGDGVGEHAPKTVAIRVKSGDCLHLDGEARWAWHAMSRTIPGTCPGFLKDWPVGTPGADAEDEKAFRVWKGWMGSKRINISCRQVWD